MSLQECYIVISILISLGMVQSSLEVLIAAIRTPTLLNIKLSNVVQNKRVKVLKSGIDSPYIWWLISFKLILALLFLISTLLGSIPFYIPLLYIVIDNIGILRWRLFGNTETPVQRAVLVCIAIHYGFDNIFLSQISLLFMVAMLCLSYFAAAWHKSKEVGWRNGKNMQLFFTDYLGVLKKVEHEIVFKILGILLLLFQFSFAASMLNISFMYCYLIFGFLFHFVLVAKKGINFFFWTFISVYPAIYYFTS